jgi:thiazole/oxazole-forming peptide maturase SagD family component
MSRYIRPDVLVILSKNLLILGDGRHTIRFTLPSKRHTHPLDPLQLPIEWIERLDPDGKLMGVLENLKWLTEGSEAILPSGVRSLRDALWQARTETPAAGLIVTSQEALVIGRTEAGSRTELLRRFVSRLDWRRLCAYANLTWRDSSDYWTWGDLPPAPYPPGLGAHRRAEDSYVLAREAIDAVIPSGDEQEHLDWTRVKSDRLANSALLDTGRVDFGGLTYWLATGTYAQPNLAFVPDPSSGCQDQRWCMGVATKRDLAITKAYAEGVERYTMGDYQLKDLTRASASELSGTVLTPDELVRYSRRQQQRYQVKPFEPARPDWWVAGSALSGHPVWLPASVIFCPFGDNPEWLLPGYASSNGTAAHGTLAAARLSAWLELNERDAFMRTFLSQIIPPRVRLSLVPQDLVEMMAYAKREFGLHEIHLGLMTSSLGLPVYGCFARSGSRFAVGASCKADRSGAMEKSISEILLQLRHPFESAPIAPEDVVTPEHHAQLYSSSAYASSMDWIFENPSDPINFSDVLETEPKALIAGAFFFDRVLPEGLFVSKSIDPRLIQMTFGFDTLPEDHAPVQRAITSAERLLTPHPFP